MPWTRVIIESPYAGPTESAIAINVRYARACAKHALSLGEAPFLSHLLYTQEGILNDTVLSERMMGIDAGWAWAEAANLAAFYVDLGMSAGMVMAEQRYRMLGKPMCQRSLPPAFWPRNIAGFDDEATRSIR